MLHVPQTPALREVTPALSVPRLLVSVRNLAEACSASLGGADVIDVKEPARGPLGRADADVIHRIVGHVRGESPDIPVSAALGEVTDDCHSLNVRRRCPLTFAKLGLSGLRHRSNWVADWLEARQAFTNHTETQLQWVAVAYADAEQAAAPPMDDVLQAAVQTGCAGLLIDTFDKAGGQLLDHLSIASLAALAAEARDRGLFFAAAGRLRIEDIPTLRPVSPDIIAVRSAACEGDDRQTRICSQQVQALRQAVVEAFSPAERASLPESLTANR